MTQRSNAERKAGAAQGRRTQRERERNGGSAVADPAARAFLWRTDPILRELIDARPDFRPRVWLNELPAPDAQNG
jgi:hypothetical protein